jgi:hypothetical protein
MNYLSEQEARNFYDFQEFWSNRGFVWDSLKNAWTKQFGDVFVEARRAENDSIQLVRVLHGRELRRASIFCRNLPTLNELVNHTSALVGTMSEL